MREFSAPDAQADNVLGKRIRQLRKDCAMSGAEFANQLKKYGVTVQRGAVSKWELGDTLPSCYQLAAIAEVFGLDRFSDIFGSEDLNEEGIRRVNEYRNDLIASGQYAPNIVKLNPSNICQIPLYLVPVSAGTGNDLLDSPSDMLELPQKSVPAGTDFCVRISGDSMEPTYADGQIVFVSARNSLSSGEIGVFSYDGAAYIKQYAETIPSVDSSADEPQSSQLLISKNKKYPPILVDISLPFRIFGKVLGAYQDP